MADKDFVVKNGMIVNTNLLVANATNDRVGINTATPDATLTVAGTANVSGNVAFSSNFSVTGNTYLNGRFEVNNSAYIEKKLYVGNTATMIQDLPTIIQAVDNFNGFVMISSQNLSKLDDACADLITYADNTNGLSHFNDIGINNSRFDGTIHRIITNAAAGSWQLNETVFQKNNAGANIAVGVIRDIVSINATAVSLKISVSEDDGLQTYVGISDFVPTSGANLAIRAVTSAANADILFAVPFFSPLANTLSRRNYGFTVGKRGDGYLYNANSALTIGTTAGGLRTTEYSLSLTTFTSGQTTLELSSGNTDLLYADMIVTGTGIPTDAYIRSIANSTAFVLSKTTTAGSAGTYSAKDPYYDATGNPIIFHVNGMMAKDEVGRFNGNGNFTIGANTTARNSKLTVAGTANITGNVAFGNNIIIAGNAAITGSVNATSVLVGANVAVNTTAIQIGNTTANLVANSILVKVSNSTSTANLTPLDLKIGSTTVVNSSQVTATLHVGNVSGSYANITGQVNTATLYAATSANIASAVQANATGVYTTGTVNAASHSVGTAFTANSTVVNAVSYYSGTLLVANTTVSNATHLVGATWAAPSVLGSSTANGASLTYANVSGQVNTATLYATTSANIASTVQANSSGLFSTLVANAQNFTSGAGFGQATAGMVANSGTIGVSTSVTANAKVTAALIQVATNLSIANLTAVDLKIGTSVVNNTVVAAGANVIANTTAIFIGNTIANAVVNSILIQVANSSHIANLTPIDLTLGTTIVNTSLIQVGTAAVLNTSAIKIGAATNAVTTNTTAILMGNSSVFSTINSTTFTGTANNASYLGTQLPSYYNDATNLTGTVPAARLPTGNATHIGGLQIVDSVTNTSITVTATANSVKTAYDAGISAYTNAIAYSGNAAAAYANAVANAMANVSANYAAKAGATFSGAVAVGNTLSSGNTSITGSLTATTNVNFNSGTLFVDSVTNRVGIGNTAPDAALKVTGAANISGNLSIGGNFTVNGTFTTVGTTTASGDFVPSTNNSYSLGNTTFRWANVYVNNAIMGNIASAVNFIGTTVNATANISVGANVVANLTSVKVGDATNYSFISNSVVETTGNVYLTSGIVVVGANVTMNTTTMNIGNTSANTIANSIVIRISDSSTNVAANLTPTGLWFGNSTVNAIVNSTVFTGTAYNSGNLNSQPASYYTNATNINAGTLDAARLPTGNATTIGGLQIIDSVSNTSITITATANSVKTAYDRAATAYSNAVSYADGRIIDSVTNTFVTYAASANSVKNAYDRAIDANTRAASAQTAAVAAYSNAIGYSGNAASAFANAAAYTDSRIIDSIANTSTTYAASANSVKNAYDRAIDANTRAASAQTAAVAAYSNAVSTAASDASTKAGTAFTNAVANAAAYTDSRIIDSIANTSTTYAASANSVKNAYDRAIDANTRADSAQTAATSAYSNAIAYSGNAALAFANAVAYVEQLRVDSVTSTSNTSVPTSNTVKNAYDRAIDANTRAASAQTEATSAYSNGVTYTDTKAAAAYSNGVTYTDAKAATAFANAVANSMANVAANFAALTGATFAGAVIVSNNFTVTGNLTVTGTTFSANVTNLDVTDKNITMAKGVATVAAADGAGITVDVANVTWNYNHATISWQSNVAITPATNNNLGFGTAGLRWSNGHITNVYSTNINATDVNATTLTGNVYAGYANVTGQVNTSTLFASTSANVGANVQMTTTTIKVGNTTLSTTNAIFGGTIAANGSIGTAGQILTSAAGANAYWATATGGAYYKGNQGSVGAIADKGNLYKINSNTQTSSVTIDAGENALTAGPMVIASGQNLTISTGGRVVII